MSRLPEPQPVLTYALRDLIWSVQSEVDILSSLARTIDDRVRALNALRRELAERLVGLDELCEQTGDPQLSAFLLEATQAPLPRAVECSAAAPTSPSRAAGQPP